LRDSDWLAGAGGFEPPNGGIKICLTALMFFALAIWPLFKSKARLEARIQRYDSSRLCCARFVGSILRMEGPEGWRLSGRAAVRTRSGFQPCSRHIEIGLAFILGLCLPRPSKAFFRHYTIIIGS
jgi:hypothetical protein